MARAFSAFRVVALLLLIAGAGCAADSGKAVLLSPKGGKALSGRNAEVAVGYSFEGTQVTYAELYVDGKLYAARNFESPKPKGVCSFVCDCAGLPSASHTFLVKLFSGDKLLGSTSGSAQVISKPPDASAPKVRFNGISSGQRLTGRQEVRLAVQDDADAAPMVAVHVDKDLKLLSNKPPYSFTWDTSEAEDGEHIVEVYATDEAGNTGKADSIRVVVANHPGRTMLAKTPDSAASSAPVNPSDPAAVKVATVPPTSPGPAAPSTEAARSSAQDFPQSPFLSGTSYGPPIKAEPPKQASRTADAPALRSNAPPASVARAEHSLPAPAARAAPPVGKPNLAVPAEDIGLARQVAPPTDATDAESPAPPKPTLVALAPPHLPDVVLWPAPDVREVAISRPQASRAAPRPPVRGLMLNGKVLNGTAPPSITHEGVGMVSVRQVVEAMGGQVAWDPRHKTVSAKTPLVSLRFTMGENAAVLDRRQTRMKTAAYVESGRAMVSIAFLADALGLEIYYDVAENRFVLAKKPDGAYG